MKNTENTPTERRLTDSEIEALIDAKVQRRLRSDRAYRNAEDADAQAKREEEIGNEEEAWFYLTHPGYGDHDPEFDGE